MHRGTTSRPTCGPGSGYPVPPVTQHPRAQPGAIPERRPAGGILSFVLRSGVPWLPPGLRPAAGGSRVPEAGPAALARAADSAAVGRPRKGPLLIP